MKKAELVERIETLRKAVNQAEMDIRATDCTVTEKIEVVEDYINPGTVREINVCWHCADIIEDDGLLTALRHIQLTYTDTEAKLDTLRRRA